MSNEMYRLSLERGHTASKIWLQLVALFKRLGVMWRCRDYDLVFMQRECLPGGPLLLERWFKWLRKVTVFDYDDALFIYKPNTFSPMANLFKNPQRIGAIMKRVDCVLAGNDWLRDKAANYCSDSRTFYVAEDLDRYTVRPFERTASTVTVGWLGSPSTEKYLDLIRPALQALSAKYPEMRLKIIGGGRFTDPGIAVEHVPWSLEEEVAQLHSFDVGIMPLPMEEWSRGKSGGKARTCMAVGIPVVCTRIGFNEELIHDGETGFLADSLEGWIQALSSLIESPELRWQVGCAARKEVAGRFALDLLGPEFANTLAGLVAAHQVRRP